MFMVLAVPGFASAASADDDPAVDFFPTINSASIDFPITLNVEAKEVGTGDTGFFTSGDVSDKAYIKFGLSTSIKEFFPFSAF